MNEIIYFKNVYSIYCLSRVTLFLFSYYVVYLHVGHSCLQVFPVKKEKKFDNY